LQLILQDPIVAYRWLFLQDKLMKQIHAGVLAVKKYPLFHPCKN
jgi:hypothetical protein